MRTPWFVFDLDETLCDRLFNRLMDAYQVLQYCKDNGYIITLASFNTGADIVLKEAQIYDFFHSIRFGRDKPKSDMIKEMAKELGLDHRDAILFDDLYSNCRECLASYINSVKVNPITGVRLSQVKGIIERYNKPIAFIKLPDLKYAQVVEAVMFDFNNRYYVDNDSYDTFLMQTGLISAIVGSIAIHHEEDGYYYQINLYETSLHQTSKVKSYTIESQELQFLMQMDDFQVIGDSFRIAFHQLKQKIDKFMKPLI